VAADRIVVDPGIGFGKTPDHSLEVLHRLAELRAALGLPLLVGTSRKRFIGEILDGAPADQRLEGTAASVVLAVAAGADVVRVHDVEPVTKAVRVADAIVRYQSGRPATSDPEVPGRIAVRGIVAAGRHGVGDDERTRAQPFEIDVLARLDVGPAAARDRLEDTVDYAALSGLVAQRVDGTSYHLLETLAADIGQATLDRWPMVSAVEVAVRKPEAPMPVPVRSVEVRIRLGRGPQARDA
jgi:dihydropteroate synthase